MPLYIETHLGGGAIMQRKPPALRNIGIDRNARSIRAFGCPYEVELVHGCCHRFLSEFPFVGDELVYSDPPYLQRKSQRRYRYDYTQADHEQLLALLKSLPCAVMLSGCPLRALRAGPAGLAQPVAAGDEPGRSGDREGLVQLRAGARRALAPLCGPELHPAPVHQAQGRQLGQALCGHAAGRAAGGAGRAAGGRGRVMPSVSEKSLRAELESVKGQVAVLRKGGQVSPEVDAVLRTLLSLLALLVAVLLEKTTRPLLLRPVGQRSIEGNNRAGIGPKSNRIRRAPSIPASRITKHSCQFFLAHV